MDKSRFEELFHLYLARSDLSQTLLARRLGVHRATVNKWITFANRIPFDRLLHCSDLFGLSAAEQAELMDCAGYKAVARGSRLPDLPPLATPKAYDAVLYRQPDLLLAPSVLYGRDGLITDLMPRLAQGQHLLLTGYGGSGKTALATTVARLWLIAEQGPVLWLGNPGDADSLFEAMLVPFEVDHQISSLVGQARLVAVNQALSQQKPGLVLLDDLRDMTLLATLRRVIPQGVPLLLTSRQDSANVDRSFRLDELSAEAAKMLLAGRADSSGGAGHDYLDDPDTFRLCQRLGGYPLGLVIAGAWLRQNRQPPRHLLELFDSSRQDPLTLEMPPSFVERGHHTAKLLLDETFKGLSVEAQRTLRALGGLPVPHVSAPLLAIYRNQPPYLTVEVMAELERWNFVDQPTAGFYRLHDMIHEYARMLHRRLHRPDPTGFIVSLRRYTQTFVHAFSTLHLDLPLILHAAEAADNRARLAILAPVITGGYFDAYGHRVHLLYLLDQVLAYLGRERAEKRSDQEQEKVFHHLLSKRGNAHFDRAEYQLAVSVYQQALDTAYSLPRRVMLLGLLGKSVGFQGDEAAAKAYFERAHQVLGAEPDDDILSFLLEQEAHAAGHNEDHATAREVAAQQVTLCARLVRDEPTPHHFRIYFNALTNLGTAEQRLRRLPLSEILAIHQEADCIARAQANAELIAHSAWALGEIYHGLGDRAEASRFLQQALSGYGEQGKLRDLELVERFIAAHGYGEEVSPESE